MAPVKLIVEMEYKSNMAEAAFAAQSDPLANLETRSAPKIAGFNIDESFAATVLPGLLQRKQATSPFDTGALLELATEPTGSTFLLRGEAEQSKVDDIAKAAGVRGVYADVMIEPCEMSPEAAPIICPGDGPRGTDLDVERLLCVPRMKRYGMDGSGVLVAIVDTGINLAHLNAKGKTPGFDAARSWVPRAGLTPGSLPVGHGTMCAFDACIAAPKCTLLDIALLQSTLSGTPLMHSFLSDAVRAYSHLIRVMTAPRRPGDSRSMVVNNSWGMFHPSWDFPPGHASNYSDNPNHPFNRAVQSLERAGADILFAAGNCGSNCPDGRCQGVTTNAIYGANGHPAVLCVAGVDTLRQRVGYSTQGPGRLERRKPDLCGYTHFKGSGVYAADGGTSAATPVVTGVVAAVRTKRPYNPASPASHPAAIRDLMRKHARDLGAAGFDFDHGFGVVDSCSILRSMFGWVLVDKVWLWDFCKRHPNICKEIRKLRPHIPFPERPPIPDPIRPSGGPDMEVDEDIDLEEFVLAAYLAGSGGKEPPAAEVFADEAPHLEKADGECGCGH